MVRAKGERGGSIGGRAKAMESAALRGTKGERRGCNIGRNSRKGGLRRRMYERLDQRGKTDESGMRGGSEKKGESRR